MSKDADLIKTIHKLDRNTAGSINEMLKLHVQTIEALGTISCIIKDLARIFSAMLFFIFVLYFRVFLWGPMITFTSWSAAKWVKISESWQIAIIVIFATSFMAIIATVVANLITGYIQRKLLLLKKNNEKEIKK